MKKFMIVLAVIATVGFIAIQVSACMWDGYYGGGDMGGYSGGYTSQDGVDQDFLNETAQLRQDIASKRGEYNALISQPSPNPKRVTKLSQEITVLYERLHAKAQARGYVSSVQSGGHNHSQMGRYGYSDSRGSCW